VYQRNNGSILGLFIVGVVVVFILGLFIRVVSALFPLLVLLIFVAFFWSVIKNFFNANRPSGHTRTEYRKRSSKRQTSTQARKKKVPKETIDVEYTVIDDEPKNSKQNKDSE